MSIEAVSSSTTSSTSSSSNSSLTQLDFLTLLTTQMEYQDPTNPVDNTEMVNQMTQYSSLEQEVSTNAKLDTIVDQLTALSAMNSSSYIGKDVTAEGGVVEVTDGVASDVTLNLGSDAASLVVNIYDADGNIVDTKLFSDVTSGDHTLGQTELNPGSTLTSGEIYTLRAAAYDENGDNIDVDLTSVGTVTSVSSESSGVVLTLDDGREVSLADVSFAS
ncbi:flagellar hook assembly protein FlgD [Desulfovibrio gilichinskyi]|uniref:Basal-body rod modification protein FlgD n=1 Tax=Desulfovibrio gilichinskyi TaxID=1519643 RepID=A0A1X7CFI8_9BACT|nr:flagellar hook capping FlgD N-terminal domain-containing protein [Desulfovibrio gilichinskyi]SME95327.1 flagellar basal-body rod modification protein FlgD [Desulfovibrio gilichinskyi]